MGWQDKAIAKYFERRRANPKQDLIFLTPHEREKHICHNAKDFNLYLSKHLAAAEQAKKEGRPYFLVMDVEMAPDTNFGWHKKELRLRGVSEAELSERTHNRDLLRERGEWRKPHLKVAKYWECRDEELKTALSKGSVASIALSAADDRNGDIAVAAHCCNIIYHDYNGFPQMPPLLETLLVHPSVRLVNVAQWDDVDDVIKSFYREKVSGIRFIDAEDFFLAAWGSEWNGRDEKGKPRSTTGVLNIVEKAYPGRTFFKNPKITTSDWTVSSDRRAETIYFRGCIFPLPSRQNGQGGRPSRYL